MKPNNWANIWPETARSRPIYRHANHRRLPE